MKTPILLAAPLLLSAWSILAQPHGYGIAYNVAQDEANDDYEIYFMNADGTGKTNLTRNPDVAWTYHAYQDTIFFISDRGASPRCFFLYTMDARGQNIRKISDLQLEDSWLSTRQGGREIVVAGRVGQEIRHQLFIIDVATGACRQITTENGALHAHPLFSPDGKRIVFSYKKDRTNREEYEDLYIMDADGSNRQRLTTYPKDDRTSHWHSYHAGPPQWNSKENFISYQSVQQGKSSLYAVTPDGQKHWKLTDQTLNEGYHAWSPDGQWLAIEMYDQEQTSFGIYLMNYETKETRALTDPTDFKYQQSPVFVKTAPPFDADLAQRLGADAYGMKSYVFATLKTGPTKLAGEENQRVMAGHLKNIARLANEGKLVLAGPFLEKDDRRGIFIFDVRTKEEAAELVKTDPAVAAGVFEVEVRLWYGSAALPELNRIHESIAAKPIAD